MTGQDNLDISDESDTASDNSSDGSSDESYSSMLAQEGAQPGSLPLLLNTLDQRPDLGNLVRGVTLDWCGEEIYSKTRKASTMIEQAVLRLLCHCPLLDRFVTHDLPRPRVLARMHHAQVAALATSFITPDLHIIFRIFPALRHLYLIKFRPADLSGDIPNHSLTTLKLRDMGNDPNLFFTRALQLCGETVQDLTLEYNGYSSMERRDEFAPVIPRLLSNTGVRLVTMDLDDLRILEHPSSGIASCLRDLPALRHLRVSRNPPLSPEAFAVLPHGLHSLTLTAYSVAGWGDRYSEGDFVSALIRCLECQSGSVRVVERVVITSNDFVGASSDYRPLVLWCNRENISVSNQIDDVMFTEIKLICKLNFKI